MDSSTVKLKESFTFAWSASGSIDGYAHNIIQAVVVIMSIDEFSLYPAASTSCTCVICKCTTAARLANMRLVHLMYA